MTFIDSEKAFDSGKREIMWLMLQEYGIPGKIIQITKILYYGFKCKISHEGNLSDFKEVRNGVRQGRILFPNPFSANIRQSHEKSERFKEKGNTVEYEGKIGRSGLCGYLSVSPEILRYGRKAKKTKRGSRIRRFAY